MKARGDFSILEERPEDNDRAEYSMSPKDIKDMNRITLLTDPHKYQADDDAYGRNAIAGLIFDFPDMLKKWMIPPTPSAFVSEDRAMSNLCNFYKSAFEKMVKDYTKNLVSKGIMKTYDEVVNKTSLIDISRLYKGDPDYKMSMSEIRFRQEDVEFLRTHGWYSFYPCFSKVTLKVNRKRYSYIELISVNEEEKSATLHVENYFGDKYDWIINNTGDITIKFDHDDGENQLGFDYEWSNVMMYERILVQYMPDMKWDKRQCQFWYDIFSVNAVEKLVVVKVTPQSPFDFKKKKGVVLAATKSVEPFEQSFSSIDDIPFMQEKTCTKIEILYKGNDAMEKMEEALHEDLTSDYLHMLGAVNLNLFRYPPITEEKPDGKQMFKFGKMTVTSDACPVPPSRHKIARPRKGD